MKKPDSASRANKKPFVTPKIERKDSLKGVTAITSRQIE